MNLFGAINGGIEQFGRIAVVDLHGATKYLTVTRKFKSDAAMFCGVVRPHKDRVAFGRKTKHAILLAENVS